jgi:hypothetical protein
MLIETLFNHHMTTFQHLMVLSWQPWLQNTDADAMAVCAGSRY